MVNTRMAALISPAYWILSVALKIWLVSLLFPPPPPILTRTLGRTTLSTESVS